MQQAESNFDGLNSLSIASDFGNHDGQLRAKRSFYASMTSLSAPNIIAAQILREVTCAQFS